MATALKVLKWLSYAAFVIMMLAGLAIQGPFAFDICVWSDNGTFRCDPTLYRAFVENGFLIFMMGVYTVVPAALAVLGLFFLLFAAVRRAT